MAIQRENLDEQDEEVKGRTDNLKDGGAGLPNNIRSLEMMAKTRTRQKWLELEPKNETIMVGCNQCQKQLEKLTWVRDKSGGIGYFEPVYKECERHPTLFRQRVADLTSSINHLYQHH